MEDNGHSEPLTITVEEAGRRLGISRGLAYELVRRGEIPAIRLGYRRIVIPAGAVEAIVRERATPTAAGQ
ncbi:MAG: helix-turn-helix domain-containing protein [Ilumatobacteraceae bacterium]